MADEVVAIFDIQLAGCNPYNTHGTIEVCGNEQFVLGRDLKCRYSWHDDLTISREHLRIHCILYEQDPIANIAPFVYATDLSANGTYLKKSNAECTGSQGRGILMGKNSTFLLDDGDELRLSDTINLVYRSFGEVKQSVLTATQEREKAVLASRYLVTGRLLGEGGYGKVLLGINQKTQRQLACKMVNIGKLYDRRADLCMPTSDGQWTSSQAIERLPAKIQSCFREFDILKDLSHPNIVHIQKVFWSRSTIYMFQELVTGGDLFSYIEYKDGKISSIESAVIVRQILKGVQYLHDRDIVHRDLKPDNVLMTSLDSGARVVITDFGNARFLPNANNHNDVGSNRLRRMFSMAGTLEYAAPEIHRANRAIPKHYGYSLSVDMWAIGSITAVVLTGEQLFSCRQDGPVEEDARRVIIDLAAQCDLSILDDRYHPRWGAVGHAPKDFIKRLLVLKEEERMSAAEALEHVWFTHPMMATEFEAQYERSIRDWRPRRKDNQLIEQVPTLHTGLSVQKAPVNSPAYDTTSRFFTCKQAPSQNMQMKEHEYKDAPRPTDEFASQPVYPTYDLSYKDNGSEQYNQTNNYHRVTEHHDEATDWFSNGQQTYAEFATDDPSIPQRKRHVHPDRTAAGQLKRVSTATRGKYFQREIVDLDDLGGPSDEREGETGADDLGPDSFGHAHHRSELRREDTVQVCATPVADSEQYDGVDLWWNERYPQTQFHYGTQAEPVTQDEDLILVHETPPEVFVKPSRPRAWDVNRDDYHLERHLERRRAIAMPFAYRVNKQRRVYGRQR